MAQHLPHLAARQHHRQTLRRTAAWQVLQPAEILDDDLPVQEKKGAERLVRRRSAHSIADGARGQELRHFGRVHLPGMAPAVMNDEAPDPVDVRLLRPRAQMPRPNGVAHPVEQPRRLSVGHPLASCAPHAGLDHGQAAARASATWEVFRSVRCLKIAGMATPASARRLGGAGSRSGRDSAAPP